MADPQTADLKADVTAELFERISNGEHLRATLSEIAKDALNSESAILRFAAARLLTHIDCDGTIEIIRDRMKVETNQSMLQYLISCERGLRG